MLVSSEIPFTFSVLRTIDLNDQPRFKTHKVYDIAIDRNLSLEFESLKLTATQRLPEHVLSLGGITAHCSGKLPMSIRNVAMQEFSRFHYRYCEKHPVK